MSKLKKHVVSWKRLIEVASNKGVAERVADLTISSKETEDEIVSILPPHAMIVISEFFYLPAFSRWQYLRENGNGCPKDLCCVVAK